MRVLKSRNQPRILDHGIEHVDVRDGDGGNDNPTPVHCCNNLLDNCDLNVMEPNFWLVGSSFFFLIPSYTAWMYNEKVVSGVTAMIFLTSATYHATKPRYPLLLALDIGLANVGFVYGSYTAFMWWPQSVPFYLCYLSYGLGVYHIGRAYSMLIWDTDPWTATCWHMGMHLGFSVFNAYSFMMMKSHPLQPLSFLPWSSPREGSN